MQNKNWIYSSLEDLKCYVEKEKFKGYDPYDTLNSCIPFTLLGNYFGAIITQIQKRNPINIRPFIGIRKGFNPKGMGLFLKSYSLLYKRSNDKRYLETATWLFDWLLNNNSRGYSGICWGSNFDWVNPKGKLSAYTPSVVVTSFVVDGIYEYYKIAKNEEVKKTIESAADYIINDIPISFLKNGISFSYTHSSKDICYNASLLAAEILAKADYINKRSTNRELINEAISYVISRQKTDGSWFYSYDKLKESERKQIDFHQGFILVSLANLKYFLDKPANGIDVAIAKGLKYYRANQFFNNGISYWRVPKRFPIDIHNQSQGIITFSRLKHYGQDYLKFAVNIAKWTIENMQSNSGYFFYRKTPLFNNKISYMRWSQAWMMLALVELLDAYEVK